MKLDLNQITIQVRDVEKSIGFYQKLGLKLIVESLPKYARFECVAGETTFSLHHTDENLPESSTWLYFETKTLDEDVTRLQSLGIEIEKMPVDQEWLWREARIKDPDGHIIILYFAGKNRKNPPWRIK